MTIGTGQEQPDTLADRAFALVAARVGTALNAGEIAGAALGVVDASGNRAVRLAGHAALLPEPVPLRREHLFDLASLTKPLFTTATVLGLAEAGRIELDAPLAAVIRDLRQYDVANAPERRLTPRDLLSHQTFLPAVEPLYTRGLDPLTLRAFVLQRSWTRTDAPVYSDINFILLGIAIERLTGRKLLDHPLPPGFTFTPAPGNSVATEFCFWRERMLRGVVHDENAHALGGAAGHAGLFGTVDAVLDEALALLDGSALSPEGLRTIRRPVGATRTVGWERAHPGWSGGARCSEGTIGHVGFTGTGLWIDFRAGLAWTLLTNRVHPSRHRDTGIAALRRAVGQAIFG
ncbi:serine hydrolase domain-containing protein [Rhizosaccharibacter radicis]|uniref:Beta-lactamase family protein n=1 Tax=Rhizosaccharibacter radicis TaxID=2782605 RepID=A0ABT1VWM9_9PROT|nr:beta-lactamase family protein [Acetobacteraceae bacterium KSS12]